MARILVVDDDPATRVGVAELLKRAGHDVAVCGTYEAARQAIREQRPDLLITDIRLGEYNGLQLFVADFEPLRAIVITGYSDPVLESEARSHGARFLLKPVPPGVLLRAVEEELASEPGAPRRRWWRKRLLNDVSADVNGTPARIVDVSYGGLRVEFERTPDRDLPSSFTVQLPGLSVPVDLVWRQETPARTYACGLAVLETNESIASGWYGLVDSIA
jgi:CheY-like chemotaxis protein